GGGGYPVCGLADVNPGKYGQVQNYITSADKFGTFSSRSDFIGATVDARLPHSIRLNGGFDTGRSVRERCYVVDSPQDTLNCRVVTPFSAQTQYKANGVVPGKYDVMFSFAWQNVSGPSYGANYAASNADIIPSLGRPLSGGIQTPAVAIPLVAPQTLFEDRITRLDLRLSKILKVNKYRFQINLDAYNALNSNAIRAVNSTYGAA